MLKSWYDKIILWLSGLKEKHFILAFSVFVGLTAGVVAVVLKNFVRLIEWVLTNQFNEDSFNFLYAFYPLLGLLLTFFIVKKVISGHPGPGIAQTLYAISRRKSILKRKQMFSSLLTSVFTVGFGGSAGLEAPAVQTSASISTNLAARFNLNYKTKTLMIGCAAAGSMAAIFKAPIAAIIFAVEVIMIDLTTASLVPLLVASLMAFITSNLFLGNDQLIQFKNVSEFNLANLHYYLIFAVLCGISSLYFNKIYLKVSRWFENRKNVMTRILVGGSLVGVIVLLFPPIYGEGYQAISHLLNNNLSAVTENSIFHEHIQSWPIVFGFLGGLIVLKAVATAATLGSGGVGGIFAPTIFMGGSLGYLYSKFLNEIGIGGIPYSNFVLVGMAGLIAGVAHAPLMAIFLIAEITGGYQLFVPLMITSGIAFYTTRLFTNNSIYTAELAKRGELITHNKDKAVLTLLNLEKEIETDFVKVQSSDYLQELLAAVTKSKRNLFPVIDDKNQLIGVITLDDFREIMFDKSLYKVVKVSDLMSIPPAKVELGESMISVMKKFDETGAWNLPVVKDNEYFGFVSKSKLFSAYREMLVQFSEGS